MNRSRSLTCTSSSCWVENENNYMDVFTHIKRWSIDYTNVQPCCTTEKLVFVNCRSEEPVSSNMDISTGHIVLVSIWKKISYKVWSEQEGGMGSEEPVSSNMDISTIHIVLVNI